MMNKYMYGEDSLTIWALEKEFNSLLKALTGKDEVNEEECGWIYRPSFGRGKNLGEFDAIIYTPSTCFLIESKWDNSSEVKKSKQKIELEKKQIKRHKVFRKIYAKWGNNEDFPWGACGEGRDVDGWIVPKKGTKLIKNMEFVVDRINGNGRSKREIKNILLLFLKKKEMKEYKGKSWICSLKKGEETEQEMLEEVEDFKVILFQYEPAESSKPSDFISF